MTKFEKVMTGLGIFCMLVFTLSLILDIVSGKKLQVVYDLITIAIYVWIVRGINSCVFERAMLEKRHEEFMSQIQEFKITLADYYK